MKNKKVLLILLLAVLFIPVVARAEAQYVEREIVNFTFAVEDEKGRDFGDLKFKIKSLDGKIEYASYSFADSWLNSDNYGTNIYSFRNTWYGYSIDPINKDASKILKSFFTAEDIQKLEESRIDELGLESEDAKTIYTNYVPSIGECGSVAYSTKAYYKFVPLLLEEVDSPREYDPIKKVVYGFVMIIPTEMYGNNYYVVQFNLLSRLDSPYSISSKSSFPRCDNSEYLEIYQKVYNYTNSVYLMNNLFYKYLDYNRRGTVTYNDNLVQGNKAYGTIIGSTTPVTSEYFNRSTEIKNYSTVEENRSYTNNITRNQTMNVVENESDLARVNTYVVFVKTPSNAVAIPDTLKNVGIPIFIFTIVCIGIGIFVLLKKKSTKEEKEVKEVKE